MTKIDRLTEKNILLRPMVRRDKDAIFEILSDPGVRQPFGLFSERRFGKDMVAGWCAIAASVNAESTGLDKFYVIKKGRRTIGYFGAGPDTDFPERINRWEVGYFLDARYRGQGIIPDIFSSFSKEAKRGSLVREFFAVVKPDNAASARVLEKNGFTKQGVDKEWAPYIFYKDGSYKKCRPPKTPMDVYKLKIAP